MNDLRDTQLSAMYDGELPPEECELVARRLTRDPKLRAEWARYALIGAALRGEPAQAAVRVGMGAAPQALNLALPVGQALGTTEVPMRDAIRDIADERRWRKALAVWAQPVLGAGIAAGVAALSIIWLQGRVGDQPALLTAQSEEVVLGDPDLVASRAALVDLSAAPPSAVVASRESIAAPAGTGEPRSYTVPPLQRDASLGLADAQLANYVVAHSEFAAPLNRRSVLSTLIASESAALVAQPGSAAAAPVNSGRARSATTPAQEAP